MDAVSERRRRIMTITQLNPTKENMWEAITQENVYLVRFSESKAKRSDGYRREMPSLPYGLSFKSVGNTTVREVIRILESGEAAIVKVTVD
jgi:hypothetical protein